MTASPSITLSTDDATRLAQLLEGRADAVVELLEDELSRATVVPRSALPADVVCVGSQVRYRNGDTERDLTLVWPHEAGEGRVSVLTPVGAALIGLRPGQQIAWPLPGDRIATLEVLSVSNQV